MSLEIIKTNIDPQRLYTGKTTLTVSGINSANEIIQHNLNRYPIFRGFFRVSGNQYLVPMKTYGYVAGAGSLTTELWGNGYAYAFVGLNDIILEAVNLSTTSLDIEIFYTIYPDRGQVV